jgi:hypothetical protein
MTVGSIDAGHVTENARTLYRAAGFSGLALAIVYVAIIGLYVAAGPQQQDVVERLNSLTDAEPSWWAIVGLSVLTDLLYLPVAAALYVALASVNRLTMLVGAGLAFLFVILDLAITWPNYAALIAMVGEYVAAASGVEQRAIAATASYPIAILDSSLLGAYITLVPGLGIMAMSLVMLQSGFDRISGYVGIATGLAAAVAVLGPLVSESLGTVAVLAATLTLVWFLTVGLRLLRLTRSPIG